MILQIVSVGPGDSGFLNSKTVEALRKAGLLVLRTGRHPLTSWLSDQGIPFRTMDSIYESAEDFDSLSSAVAAEIWNLAAEHSNTVYAVSDMMTDHTVDAVFAGKPADGRINILPGFSFSDYYLPACRDFFSVSDIRICPASSFVNSGYDPSRPLLLTELNDELTAGDVKNYLSSFIRDEETVLFFEKDAAVRPVRLYELDRQPFYNHLSAVAAGAYSYEQRNRRTLDDLISIMDRLRSPDGCSWDRAQTHESLQPYVVEEAWEVVDAIHAGQPVHLAEELGDLLFQVVFHESIGRSFDEFVMDDILGTICEKMIRRHPHVFKKSEIPSGTETPFSEQTWDRIKQEERGSGSPAEALNNISSGLPSIRYAEKVLRRLEQMPDIEIPSLKAILASVQKAADDIGAVRSLQEGEKHLGTLLFLCAVLSRKLNTDGEVLLHHTVKHIIESYNVFEKDTIRRSDALKPLTFNDLGL